MQNLWSHSRLNWISIFILTRSLVDWNAQWSLKSTAMYHFIGLLSSNKCGPLYVGDYPWVWNIWMTSERCDPGEKCERDICFSFCAYLSILCIRELPSVYHHLLWLDCNCKLLQRKVFFSFSFFLGGGGVKIVLMSVAVCFLRHKITDWYHHSFLAYSHLLPLVSHLLCHLHFNQALSWWILVGFNSFPPASHTIVAFSSLTF